MSNHITHFEYEELVDNIVSALEEGVPRQDVIDGICQFPSDGLFKKTTRADSKWIPRDPIKDNKWLS